MKHTIAIVVAQALLAGCSHMTPPQSSDRGVQGGLPPAVAADGIADGEYRIDMPLSNDNILGQVITITNCIATTPASSGDLRVMRFEIRVGEQGSFNRSGADDQLVQGIVWCGKLKFAIPMAHVTDVSVYSFEAQYPWKNSIFEGTADVPNPDGGRMKKTFWMQRIASNKPSERTR